MHRCASGDARLAAIKVAGAVWVAGIVYSRGCRGRSRAQERMRLRSRPPSSIPGFLVPRCAGTRRRGFSPLCETRRGPAFIQTADGALTSPGRCATRALVREHGGSRTRTKGVQDSVQMRCCLRRRCGLVVAPSVLPGSYNQQKMVEIPHLVREGLRASGRSVCASSLYLCTPSLGFPCPPSGNVGADVFTVQPSDIAHGIPRMNETSGTCLVVLSV